MVQEIRSLQKLAIFFRVSRWGRRGGGLVRGTLRYKVRKLSLSNTVVAFPVTSILQQCVHVPVKHSETDFIILQPNPFEHH